MFEFTCVQGNKEQLLLAVVFGTDVGKREGDTKSGRKRECGGGFEEKKIIQSTLTAFSVSETL